MISRSARRASPADQVRGTQGGDRSWTASAAFQPDVASNRKLSHLAQGSIEKPTVPIGRRAARNTTPGVDADGDKMQPDIGARLGIAGLERDSEQVVAPARATWRGPTILARPPASPLQPNGSEGQAPGPRAHLHADTLGRLLSDWLNVDLEGNRIPFADPARTGHPGEHQIRRRHSRKQPNAAPDQQVRSGSREGLHFSVGHDDQRPIRGGGGEERRSQQRTPPGRNRIGTRALVSELADVAPPGGRVPGLDPAAAGGPHAERSVEQDQGPERWAETDS